MNRFLATLSGCAVALCATVAAPAWADEGKEVGQLVTGALEAMNKEKWDVALPLLTQATDRFDKDAPKSFGPQFGVIWYRRGICELQLQRWKDATHSFETCYHRYPNVGIKPDAGNLYHKKALLKWGDAAAGAGNWEVAVRMYRKFLEERDRNADDFPAGAFHVNLAVCEYRLGELADGNGNLEIAILNRRNFPTSDEAIVSGFQALVAASLNARNEQGLLDFISRNRAGITLDPAESRPYAAIYLKLAADTTAAGMLRAGLALYQLVPDTDTAIDDLTARLASLSERPGVVDGGRLLDKARMQSELEKWETERRGSHSIDMIKLAGIAEIHEKLGNLRGARAAYQQLDRFHDRADSREANLFNLVRTSALIGDGAKTDEYGAKFLKAFPSSGHIAEVRRVVLDTLFFEGRYERCIELGPPMLGQIPGGPDHDLCLHVLGASYHYTGQYAKAQPLLDEEVTRYPQSRFAGATLFFQASNRARLQEWPKAAGLLDAFLARPPSPSTSVFLSYALCDRAECHAATQENEAALEKIARLAKEFPDCEVLDRAMNLKGGLLQAAKDHAGAAACYKKAIELAKRHDHPAVAEEARTNLGTLPGTKP